jgi:hypothetical protein
MIYNIECGGFPPNIEKYFEYSCLPPRSKYYMSKRLEFSEDSKNWRTIGACEDADYEHAWAELQKWIEEDQPYGFFRAVDDPRAINEIAASFNSIVN